MSPGSLSDDWSRVASFVAAVDASLGKWLDDNHRVGLTEYRSLTLIAAVPAKELRVNDLADQVGLNQSSVTRLVGRLEVKGLAQRDVCPADGRGVYAVITKKGEALVANVRRGYAERIAELLADPTQGKRLPANDFGEALHRIVELLPK